MMGWLIGDVVLGRQIDRADAHAIGRKVGKLGPTLKAEFGAPSRRVGKRKWQSEEARARADAEASAEESRLRRDRVSLPLPEAAPPVPLKRKRVQVSPLKAEREMPSEMSDDDSPRDESCASFNLAGVLKRGVRCAEDGVKRALELQERAHAELAQEAAAAEWSRGVLKMALLAVDRARRELEARVLMSAVAGPGCRAGRAAYSTMGSENPRLLTLPRGMPTMRTGRENGQRVHQRCGGGTSTARKTLYTAERGRITTT